MKILFCQVVLYYNTPVLTSECIAQIRRRSVWCIHGINWFIMLIILIS